MQLLVKYKDEEYVFNEDTMQYECQHINAYLDKACCNGEACACGGGDSVVCDNNSCTGISDEQSLEIWEAFRDEE